jgi:hypothetical protein
MKMGLTVSIIRLPSVFGVSASCNTASRRWRLSDGVESHQFIHLGDDAPLLGEWWERIGFLSEVFSRKMPVRRIGNLSLK